MELYIQLILAVINGALTLVIGWVGYKLRKHHKREEERQAKEIARDNLQLAVARNMLIRECNHYLDKGYAPLYAIASVAEMYDAYHKLGGNGAVTGAYHDFMQLPHAPRRDSNAQNERR